MRSLGQIFATVAVLLAAWLLHPAEAFAVPAFARQTGMNCNSCHIGTDNSPNFTHTGRIFAMKGYTRPYVRERMRHEGTTHKDEPQYGGEYLALNWDDYWSMRFISEGVSGGHNLDGTSRDTETRPFGRLSMFFTGAVTDWLGVWAEIGYLGNNALNSVTTGQEGPSGLNLFAYDEYRMQASWDFGKQSFWGISFGNEHPNVIGTFALPATLPDLWFTWQGGSGPTKEAGSLSVHALLGGKWWVQVAGTSGGDDVNLSNGWNQYVNVAYNAISRTRNDLWIIGEIYTGNDLPSLMTPVKNSFICPGTCPPGVVDSSLSFTNGLGLTPSNIVGAPVEIVDHFFSYKLSVQQAVADRGAHTWYAGLMCTDMQQDFVSGGEVQRTMIGGSVRYFYRRTYGAEIYARDNLKYEYTTPAGVVRDTHSKMDYGVTLLWNPAMNFSVHAEIRPFQQNIVFDDQRNLYLDDGDSYRLGFEYNF